MVGDGTDSVSDVVSLVAGLACVSIRYSAVEITRRYCSADLDVALAVHEHESGVAALASPCHLVVGGTLA